MRMDQITTDGLNMSTSLCFKLEPSFHLSFSPWLQNVTINIKNHFNLKENKTVSKTRANPEYLNPGTKQGKYHGKAVIMKDLLIFGLMSKQNG